MAITNLSPYVNLNGTTGQAIALYERVLGATTLSVFRAGDIPGANLEPSQKDRVIHSALRVGNSQLMLSDSASDQPVPPAGNVHVSLDFDDIDEMAGAFSALAENGAVTVPLQDTFWGGKLGMLTDRFGVRWIFNFAAARA